MVMAETFLAGLVGRVKENLMVSYPDDDGLLTRLVASSVAYAEEYQHLPSGFYQIEKTTPETVMPETTVQAVVMLASHWYESRDGSTGGYWSDSPQAAQAAREAVDRLLRLDREWKM